ncbi:C40 family peptidase [Alicyclobacillus herbarius]|uniref:C40 family peptidase n=1 Tax=Alicyclobacillus herbarius TaxID=122960 RepID=UPI0006865AEE|nr:C40 family peptidase [Alicyclobacillus herbarius]
MRLRKQLMVSVSGALVAVSALIPQVKADTLSEKQQRLNQLQSQASQVSSEIIRQQQKANTIQSQIDKYQANIDSMNQQIEENQKQVDETRAKLDRLMDQITENKKQLTEDKKKLQEILRGAYEYGQVPYLEVLFKSTSWDDLLTRLQALSQVSQSEKQLADQVAQLQVQLQAQEREQEASFRELSAKVQQLQQLRDKNVALQNQQKKSLLMVSRGLDWQKLRQAQLQNQISSTKDEINALKQEAQRTAAESAATATTTSTPHHQSSDGGNGSSSQPSQPAPPRSAVTATTTSTPHHQSSDGGNGSSSQPSQPASPSQPLVSGNGSDIAVYAESFVGYPYVWGAAGPNAFDCSGLVMYVYHRFGISMPHSSYAQFGMGEPVAKSNLQPGDLVFFSTDGAGASHVGIYIGDGNMVSAQSPRSGVKIANIFSGYWASYYIGARRIVH